MIRPGAMLKEVLRHILKKPATELYPFVKTEKPPKFRGKLKFFYEKCIGCKICMKDCPSNAIIINKVGEKMFDCEVRLDKCVYCGQCVLSCPKQALEMTKDFELADTDRKRLKVTYHASARPENTDKKPTE
jgi:formate hydrogenlyase subunit 6/NADH:ubiquinone oxidoreductase subunit I